MKHSRKRCAGEFNLIHMLVTIVVVAIAALIVIPKILGEPAFVQRARQEENARYSSERLEAYKEIGAILMYSHPDMVTGDNWQTIIESHGYQHEVFGGDQYLNVSNLNFCRWSEVKGSTKPPSETVWAYEIYNHYGQLAKFWEPCFFCTVATVESTGSRKDEMKFVYEPACLVLFADGHTEAATYKRLCELGLSSSEHLPIVYLGDKHWLPYDEWQKELRKKGK